MSLSSLPLCYCTNVHAGLTVAAVLSGLDDYTVPVSERYGDSMAAGLWLARPVIDELLAESVGPKRFREELTSRGLTCHTLNTFPYGDFHSERVKENVYIPDWADPKRLEYTLNCAAILAELLPDGVDGSMSTVPLGFKEFEQPADFRERAADQLIQLATRLEYEASVTGRCIRLAIEPEPFCLLETTAETLEFFSFLIARAKSAGAAEAVREHIGVCYDVCHQAVEFEDVGKSIRDLDAAGIRINKVHITCAIKVPAPGGNIDVREALARYAEPRYLHQTMARTSDGSVLRLVDLTQEFATSPPDDFAGCDEWRVHFHVPVNAETLGPLRTTRDELREALTAVADLDYAPHLEVETYTWEVLPDGGRTDLVDGLTAEMTATRALLESISTQA